MPDVASATKDFHATPFKHTEERRVLRRACIEANDILPERNILAGALGSRLPLGQLFRLDAAEHHEYPSNDVWRGDDGKTRCPFIFDLRYETQRDVGMLQKGR